MVRLSPLKAIRKQCLECCGGSAKEVKLCTVPNCSLYPFRFGTNPNRRGKRGGNPEGLVKARKKRLEAKKPI